MAFGTHLAQSQLQTCMLYTSKWRQEPLTGFASVMQHRNTTLVIAASACELGLP